MLVAQLGCSAQQQVWSREITKYFNGSVLVEPPFLWPQKTISAIWISRSILLIKAPGPLNMRGLEAGREPPGIKSEA